jgi:acetolactate synthase-1/2/3 large subunit
MQSRQPGPWIVGLLRAYGIDTVFGIPGVHTVPLYAGLADSGIHHVTPRHEQGAGFMADGYARVTGRPACCFVIAGPGLTNIATAMAQAYGDSIPMLVISTVTDRRHQGRGLGQLHELPDQETLARSFTAFSHTLQDLANLPEVLDRAFAVFESGRPRPVHIQIPLDLWSEPAPDLRGPASPVDPRGASAARPLVAPAGERVAEAAAALAAAERPVILAGGGAVATGAELAAIAKRVDAPVVTTVNARGLLPIDHPLSVPVSPSMEAVRELMRASDGALAVGTELGPTDYDMYETGMPTLPRPLVRIDVDRDQLIRPQMADIPIMADAGLGLRALLDRLGETEPEGSDGAERARTARSAAQAALPDTMTAAGRLLATICDTLPDAVLVGDSTQPVYAGNLMFAATRPRQWFNSATGYGTLGYALPAALGASLGAPERPVVCLVGDGGLHYSLGELAAIQQAGRPVIVLVWNNRGYGEIKTALVDAGADPVGVDLYTPDFRTLAKAYGMAAAVPRDLGELPDLLQTATQRTTATLIQLDEAVVLG